MYIHISALSVHRSFLLKLLIHADLDAGVDVRRSPNTSAVFQGRVYFSAARVIVRTRASHKRVR